LIAELVFIMKVLGQTLPVILNSRAYRDNGAVFLTWDEGAGGSDGPIGMVAAP